MPYQEKFLKWAQTRKGPWPEAKRGKYRRPVLDLAIQEGIACYLKSNDIFPLQGFLETAAKFLPPDKGAKLKPPTISSAGFSEADLPKRKMVDALCEFYGFIGDFESAWQACVQSGLDSDSQRYLTFGVHCDLRKFTARQAYYFTDGSPITAAGRTNKAEILLLVEQELKRFEAKERKNIFDFYLDISAAIFRYCSNVRGLERYSKPEGKDIFERRKFQEMVLKNFREQFEAALTPFEMRLKENFIAPDEFMNAKCFAVDRFRTELAYPLRRKQEFLYRHVYELGSRHGLGGASKAIRKIFKEEHHQVELPFVSGLVEICMATHIRKIFRDCENRFRDTLGLRGVGQGWISETALFASLKKSFPDEIVIHHARPEWIGRQHLDIYFPRLNVAVEYQGVQHRRSVAIFGGEAGLRVRKQLDQKKRDLCESNGCRLIEVFPGDAIEPIIEQIKACATQVKSASAGSPQTLATDRIAIFIARDSETAENTTSDIQTAAKRYASGGWKKRVGRDELPSCARHGDRELILRLTRERANLKKFRNAEKETLLFIACKEGNLETAEALLDVGLDPNARDWRKASILSKICNRWKVRPNPEIVRLLLERGADANLHGTLTPAIFDRCGYALPMNGCAIDCYLDCARVLFEWIKSVNLQQPRSLLTPIMCACHRFDRHRHEHRSLDMIRWLINMGADLEMRSKTGYTAMDFALGASWYQPLVAGNIEADHVSSPEILELLSRSGGRPSESFKAVFEITLERNLKHVSAINSHCDDSSLQV
ncbi:MAG TPA: ankyrin repeat domain-containing protein [Candidatus Angelobacter sp.]|nr:ankyrin repeat domain-containing protein [Candidatus Angelobacter sp.]